MQKWPLCGSIHKKTQKKTFQMEGGGERKPKHLGTKETNLHHKDTEQQPKKGYS